MVKAGTDVTQWVQVFPVLLEAALSVGPPLAIWFVNVDVLCLIQCDLDSSGASIQGGSCAGKYHQEEGMEVKFFEL